MSRRDAEIEQHARARLMALTGSAPPTRRQALFDELADDEPVDEGFEDDVESEATSRRRRGSGALLRPTHEELDEFPDVGGSTGQRVQSFVRGHLVAVCVVVLAALVGMGVYLMRSRASSVPLNQVEVVAAATPSAGSATPAVPLGRASVASSPTPTTGAPASRIRVHVLGAVRRPGVVSLVSGARVADAVAACGGMSPGAAPAELNLAAPLADGDQVLIGGTSRPRGEVHHAGEAPVEPASQATAASGTSTPGSSATTSTAVVNLNTATLEQLDQLPGVGPVTAQKILDWRSQHQHFSRVDELQEVDGIGPKSYERIRTHVSV